MNLSKKLLVNGVFDIIVASSVLHYYRPDGQVFKRRNT